MPFHMNVVTNKAQACRRPTTCRVSSFHADDAATVVAEWNASEALFAKSQETGFRSLSSSDLNSLYYRKSLEKSAAHSIWDATRRQINKLYDDEGFSAYKQGMRLEKKKAEAKELVDLIFAQVKSLADARAARLKPQAVTVVKDHGWFQEMSDGSWVLPIHERCPSCGRDLDYNYLDDDQDTWVCWH